MPDAQVSDFVYKDNRLLVSTTKGLFALVNGTGKVKGDVKTWSPAADEK